MGIVHQRESIDDHHHSLPLTLSFNCAGNPDELIRCIPLSPDGILNPDHLELLHCQVEGCAAVFHLGEIDGGKVQAADAGIVHRAIVELQGGHVAGGGELGRGQHSVLCFPVSVCGAHGGIFALHNPDWNHH